MDREMILNMEPGYEINKLIGIKIFGKQDLELSREFLPDYSNSITSAWEIVDNMQHEYILDFSMKRYYCIAEMKWRASFTTLDADISSSFGWTAPEAICKAALLFKMTSK